MDWQSIVLVHCALEILSDLALCLEMYRGEASVRGTVVVLFI